MANIVNRLQELMILGPQGQKNISGFLLSEDLDILNLTATTIANECYVANSYVTKFVKCLGYKNFADFKISLYKEMAQKDGLVGLKTNSIVSSYANDVLNSLMKTTNVINDEDIIKVATILFNSCDIHIYGVGGSGIVARGFYNKIYKLGLNIRFEKDNHLHEMLPSISKENTIYILVSYSGPSSRELTLMQGIKDAGGIVICVTSDDVDYPEIDHKILVSATESTVRQHSVTSSISLTFALDLVYFALVDLNK